jgi:DNA-binding Lrp family transcriptional regulator
MKKMSRQNDNRITVRVAARQLGCNPETVKAHIRKLFPSLLQNGKVTYLNEEQITVILEHMKQPVSSGSVNNLQSQIVGIDTSKSRVFRVDLLHRQIEAEMLTEIDELRQSLAATTKTLTETRELLEYRTAGLETIQRIAEARGLMISDRDDIEATYRRRV